MSAQNTILKIMLLGVLVVMSNLKVHGQIGQSRSDIIKDLKNSYKTDVTDNGIKYIYYEEEYKTERSSTYDRRTVIYFTTLDDGTEVCNFWKIMEPSSETNPWVSYLKNNMVEAGNMKWKDYETGILYRLDVKDTICILTAWYDSE